MEFFVTKDVFHQEHEKLELNSSSKYLQNTLKIKR